MSQFENNQATRVDFVDPTVYADPDKEIERNLPIRVVLVDPSGDPYP